MKKKLALLTTAILLASMTACAAPLSKSRTSQAPEYIITGHNFCENGLIYPAMINSDYFSYFLDFNTMERSPLCAVPNCTHRLSNCLAQQLGFSPVLYKNYFYYFEYEDDVRDTKDGSEFYMESTLKKVSLDSSEIQTVCKFQDAIPREGEGYILDGSELYFIALDPDPYNDGYGGYSWGTTGGRDYIRSIDLETGEYHDYGEVCYVEDEYPTADNTASAKIKGYYNGKMYIGYSFTKEYSDEIVENGELKWTLYNFEFDLNSKELTESELPYAAWMDEDTYCYSEDGNHFTVIDQGQTYHFDGAANEVNIPVYNGKAFGLYSWYDLSDQSEHSLGKYAVSDESNWHCVAYYDGYYIFKDGNTFEKVSEEELKAL